MAHQTATPRVASRPRRRPLLLAAEPQLGRTLGKIGALITLTAFGGALAAGAMGLAVLMVLSTVGH
jgi:hypothetical protein